MNKKVICKFVCGSTGEDPQGELKLYTARLYPVCGGSPENDAFFASTPTGELVLANVGEQHFEPGKHYYVGIITAEYEPERLEQASPLDVGTIFG